MSSTPLFDSIARRTERSTPASTGLTSAAARPVRNPVAVPAPTSPLSAPVRLTDSLLVPAALVASIEEIPARVTNTIAAEHTVRADQLVLVEAVADAITRAIVDAVATELERIARDGVVRP